MDAGRTVIVRLARPPPDEFHRNAAAVLISYTLACLLPNQEGEGKWMRECGDPRYFGSSMPFISLSVQQ